MAMAMTKMDMNEFDIYLWNVNGSPDKGMAEQRFTAIGKIVDWIKNEDNADTTLLTLSEVTTKQVGELIGDKCTSETTTSKAEAIVHMIRKTGDKTDFRQVNQSIKDSINYLANNEMKLRLKKITKLDCAYLVLPNGKRLLVVAWHGSHEESLHAGKYAFDNMLFLVERIREKEKCSAVIVGGDFNLGSDGYPKDSFRLKEYQGKVYIHTDIRNQCIDYVIAWPKENFKQQKDNVENLQPDIIELISKDNKCTHETTTLKKKAIVHMLRRTDAIPRLRPVDSLSIRESINDLAQKEKQRLEEIMNRLDCAYLVLPNDEPNDGLLLVVAWHGPHKTKEKPAAFDDMLLLVEKIRTTCKCCSVIVGGDFNLGSDEYPKVSERLKKYHGEVYDDYVHTSKQKKCIDYAVAWPRENFTQIGEGNHVRNLNPGLLPPESTIFDHDIIKLRFKHEHKFNYQTESEDNQTESEDNQTESEDNHTESEDNQTESEDNKTESEDNQTESEDNQTESEENQTESVENQTDNPTESEDNQNESIEDLSTCFKLLGL